MKVWCVLLVGTLLFHIVDSQRCPRFMDLVEEGRRCRKPCTTDVDCRGALKKCRCDDDCGLSCFNPKAECPALAGIPDGRVTYRGRTRKYNSRAQYVCNQGYSLRGEAFRSCRSDKKWSGTEAKCIKGCSYPGRKANAYPDTQEDAFSPGQSVNYICRQGHRGFGSAVVTCTVDFTWTDLNLFCGIISCPAPDEPANGRVIGNRYTFASRITFECNPGYTMMTQKSRRICTAEGTWDGRTPTCLIKRCNAPEEPAHGTVDSRGVDFTYRSRVKFNCNQGYKNIGSSLAVCNENATWEGTANCILNLECDFETYRTPTCGFTNLRNGWTRTPVRQTRLGRQGYIAVGRAYRDFHPTLTSPPVPRNNGKCFKFFYKLETAGAAMNVKIGDQIKREYRTRRAGWQAGELNVPRSVTEATVAFVVASGTVHLDDITVRNESCSDECQVRPCSNGGTCRDEVDSYTCFCRQDFTGRTCSTDLKCPDFPRSIDNGEVRITYPRESQGHHLPGTRVSYTCRDGYKITSTRYQTSVTYTCLTTKLWNANPRTISCVRKSCPPLRRIINGQMNPVFHEALHHPVGTVVTFTCSSGYRLTSTLPLRCRDSESWSRTQPSCRVIQCTSFRVTEGRLIPQQNAYAIGSTVSIECNNGFRLNGINSRSCSQRGDWVGEIPRCTAIPENPAPVNPGSPDNSAQPGSPVDRDRPGINWNDWEQWGSWGTCSSSCGPGTRKRTRRCPGSPHGMLMCRGENTEFKNCNSLSCSSTEAADVLYWGGKKYMFFDNKMNREQASRLCRQHGGMLAVLQERPEYLAIFRKLRDTNRLNDSNAYWLGLDKNSRDFHWNWVGEVKFVMEKWLRRIWTQKHWPTCVVMSTWKCGQTWHLKKEYWFPTNCWKQVSCQQLNNVLCEGSCGCLNGGSCTSDGSCHCPSKFVGDKCQIHANFCDSLPCLNGATCQVDSSCQCREGFYGARCENVYRCPQLSATLNGSIHYIGLRSSHREYGSRVEVNCNAGFKPNRKILTCLGMGQWSGELPRCTVQRCNELRIPTNGRIVYQGTLSERLNVGQRANVTCNPGYRTDTEELICESGGWSPSSSPTCNRYRCNELGNPSNGRIVYQGTLLEKLNLEQRANVRCNAGYRTETEMLICDPSGWSPSSSPTCNPRSCFFEDLRIAEGVVVRGYDKNSLPETLPSGSNITMECANSTHDFFGKSQLNCLRGLWDHDPESTSCHAPCTPLQTPAEGRFEFMDYANNSINRWKWGSRIKLSCNPGYKPSNRSDIVCQDGWSSEATCETRPCLLYGSDLHVGLKFVGFELEYYDEREFKVGASVQLECDNQSEELAEKFDRTVTCLPGGFWTADVRSYYCVASPAEPESTPNDIPITSTTPPTTTTTDLPLSDLGNCPSPRNNKNLIQYRVRSGQVRMYRFRCGPGFRIQGDKRVACLDNGEWEKPTPTCISKLCKIRPDDLSGGVGVAGFTNDQLQDQDFDPGTKAIFFCTGQNMEIIGETETICMQGGNWSHPISRTTCRAYSCKISPSELSNGVSVVEISMEGLQLKTFQPGTSATFQCADPNTEIFGENQIICMQGGNWNNPVNSTTCREPADQPDVSTMPPPSNSSQTARPPK
uniref:Sushi, von Willebrand factor type A, EGF and pentraxin domain-containing protein 1-like n=1 Tax=Phallusia mammillata TaxID=59560 RepID=A0A6F9DUA8_9ASCI|nr:sushi, von Willebrand factor type A, EGF and pentraxin domain-containing protein 1-like [Phallusia mammillata]